MRTNKLKAILKTALRVFSILPFAAAVSYAQVNLTAGPSSVTLPDGSNVPMWGYSCGTVVPASTAMRRSEFYDRMVTSLSRFPGQDLTINPRTTTFSGAGLRRHW